MPADLCGGVLAATVQSAAAEAADAVSANDHTIVFEVTSSTATTADITVTSLDANGNLSQEQKMGEPLPYTQTVDLDGSMAFDPTNANILAQAKDGSDITATITIDDNEPVTSSSNSQFATVTVMGSAGNS